jgi:type II secretory pathway component GspD/PulD (secretin)
MTIRFLFLIALSPMGICAPLQAQIETSKEPSSPAAAAAEAKEEMFTNVYTIPSAFLDSSEIIPGRDPFSVSESDSGGGDATRESVKELLEAVGISFPEGAMVTSGSNGQLIVRNTRAELEKLEAYLATILPGPEKQLFIILEMIEVNHTDFSEWLLSNQMEQDATGLRRTVQEWVREGRGTILETTTVMARSGQRSKVESIDEYIYPTEYDPPEIPNEVTLSDGATAPITGVTPTAFATRNLGVTLEVDPILSADETTIDLNLTPERVELAGFSEWSSEKIDELFKTTQPTFHTMKTTTQVAVVDGGYVLLGTTRPLHPAIPERTDALVLNFVRVDVSTAAKWTLEKEEVK